MTLKDALIASKLMGSGGGGGGETVEFAIHAVDYEGVAVQIEDYATITADGVEIEPTGTIDKNGLVFNLYAVNTGAAILITPKDGYAIFEEGFPTTDFYDSKTSFMTDDYLCEFVWVDAPVMAFNAGGCFIAAFVPFISTD